MWIWGEGKLGGGGIAISMQLHFRCNSAKKKAWHRVRVNSWSQKKYEANCWNAGRQTSSQGWGGSLPYRVMDQKGPKMGFGHHGARWGFSNVCNFAFDSFVRLMPQPHISSNRLGLTPWRFFWAAQKAGVVKLPKCEINAKHPENLVSQNQSFLNIAWEKHKTSQASQITFFFVLDMDIKILMLTLPSRRFSFLRQATKIHLGGGQFLAEKSFEESEISWKKFPATRVQVQRGQGKGGWPEYKHFSLMLIFLCCWDTMIRCNFKKKSFAKPPSPTPPLIDLWLICHRRHA